jgi:HD-GYP domain-containing protein (c-di-GMP phosphodiesterase class II)
MPSLRASRVAPMIAILAGAAVLPVLLLALSAGHGVMAPAWFHVIFAGVGGLLTAAAAIALSVSAARQHDGRAVLLSAAFSVMATGLLVHAFATPGWLVGMNGLVQLAGALNLPAGGLILAASALPALRRPMRVRLLLRLQVAVVAALAVAGIAALLDAHLIPILPSPRTLPAHLVFAAGAAVLTLLAWRAGRTYLLTRRTPDLLVCVGLVWLVCAQYGLLDYTMMDLAGWVAHGFEFIGLALVGIPAALDLRHGVASRPLVGDLRAGHLVEHEEAFLGSRVRALMVRLGDKDPSTEGHTRRVATLAVQIGERLGLPESRLRLLALGGLLHDMGKLSVPDEILNKPGKLTDDEFAVIRRHPTWGRELLVELGGFPPLVLALVESHHERIDGTGYPNRAPALELDLEVRVLTVADVFDALTADRVYRGAWPADRALALLRDGIGTAFDPACVAALRGIVAPEAPAPAWQAGVAEPAPAGPRPSPAPRTA